MSHLRHVVVAAVLALDACAFPVASESPASGVDAADVDAYERDVHPMLEASCATLDCHGAERRPLRLYVETGRRLRAALRGQPLTSEERDANIRALRTIDLGEPDVDRSMVLQKPLAVAAGGVAHVGRDVWLTRADPNYVCLRAFLTRESETAGARAACALADRLPDPPPP